MIKYNPESNLSSTVEVNEQATVKEILNDFFHTLQDVDLKVLEKRNLANYKILCSNISTIEGLVQRDLDEELFAKLKRLVIESQQILSTAIRESLPLLLLSSKNKVVEEQQRISKQQHLLVQVREQVLYFAEKFELYNSDRLELYAPDLWKEIRAELDIVESMLCDIDTDKLSILDKAVRDLLEKLEKANDVSQKKQQQVTNHLQTTKDNLDRFIGVTSSIDYPSLIVYKKEKADALYEDFNTVSESFFFNESSSALDYRVANARIDDILKMASISIPVWKDEIANEQKQMHEKKEELERKSNEEKKLSERAIKFLRNKRILAICVCLPFLFITALLLSAKPLFEDLFFLETSSLEHIAAFHGASIYFVTVCFSVLLGVGSVLFFCVKKLSLEAYSIKNLQQHLLFEQVSQKSHYFLILLFFSLCIAFVWSTTLWGQKCFRDLRLNNIHSFTHRGFDDHYIDIIENYTSHSKQEVRGLSERTLFSIYKEYRDHPQIGNYNSAYKTNLIAQRQWQKLSQILPAKKFAVLFAKNARESAIITTFNIDILQELIVVAPREKSFLALEKLIVLQPKKKQYWQMIFSFYHVENKQLAMEYFAKYGEEVWIEKILELAKEPMDVSTYKVFVKSLVVLAKRYKEQAVADYFTQISSKQQRFSEIALYGLARLEDPSSAEYLRSKMAHAKSKKVQIQIINALAKIGDKKSIADLIIALCEGNSPSFRKEVALALRELDRDNFKLWKKLAQTKSSTSRVKTLSSYSARYKLIVSMKALAKLQTKNNLAQKALNSILQHQRKQTKIALMHVFSGKELEMKSLLQKLGYKNITLVHNIEAIPQVDVVIAAEKNALSEGRIVELLAKKTKVLLLHNSGEVLSGVWQQQNSKEHREINLEPGFLGNINKQLLMQEQQSAFFVTSPYPINWKPYAGNHKGYTILHSNQTYGIIFTYNPLYLTAKGQKVFTTVIDFLLGIERFELQFLAK